MNSSSEPAPRISQPASDAASDLASRHSSSTASYVPLEYREAAEPFPTEDNLSASLAKPPTPERSEHAPDPAVLLAARIEEERRAITSKARQDAEREVQLARAEIAKAIEQFASDRDEYFRHAEEEVVSLALAIARRLIHRESQIDPRLLSGLVNYELEQLEAATTVRLAVSPETLKYWSEAAPAMSRSVEVVSDKSLAPGGVRIETALGATFVNFERELKEIERAFFDLLSRRPAAFEAAAARVQ